MAASFDSAQPVHMESAPASTVLLLISVRDTVVLPATYSPEIVSMIASSCVVSRNCTVKSWP